MSVVARLGLPGHRRATSGLPSASDIRAPKSALALISSALHPGTDLLGGGAVGPKVTQSDPTGMRKQTLTGGQSDGLTILESNFATGVVLSSHFPSSRLLARPRFGDGIDEVPTQRTRNPPCQRHSGLGHSQGWPSRAVHSRQAQYPPG